MEELGGKFFVCRNCGKPIVVTDSKDKRRVFCSKQCERIYWKRSEATRKKKRAKAREVYVELAKAVEQAVDDAFDLHDE